MADCLFHAVLMTETSSFTNIPTTIRDYQPSLLRGQDCIFDSDGKPRAGTEPLFDFARARSLDVVGGITALSSVGAPVQHADYMTLRDELLERLAEARPRVVALMLHGAMMSTECDDCEGDILARVRAIVGPDVPVVVVLDPHAHLTDAMVASADLLVFQKEYPHTDGAERMADALAIAERMLDEGIRPVPCVADCHLLGFFPTQTQPMRGFVDSLFRREGVPGVLSISFVHGFPWGDMPEVGAKVLVYTETSSAQGWALAEEIRAEIWAIRDRVMPPMISIEDAVAKAQLPRDRPLILADIADNAGGGAPADSTYLLRALMDAGVANVAVGLVYDPEAVRICHSIGQGGTVLLRVGGKIGPASGMPVDLDVEIMAVATAGVMSIEGAGSVPMGDTAWVRVGGIDIVLISLRVQLYHPTGFTHLGLDPAQRNVLVVKSSNHFQAFFAQIAGEIVWVNTPGAIDFDFARLPYTRVSRPLYPRVAHPFGPEPAQ